MINDTQQKVLSRLAHLAEFAPCNTIEFDYELRKQRLVKINTLLMSGKEYKDTTLTKAGINKLSHLVEESRL